MYCGFIDDIFLLFNGTESEFLDFHKYLNNTNKNIKLSIDYSREKIHFLDLTIYKEEDNRLHTSLCRKPTHRNSLLHYGSFHPYHQRNNIPYGWFQRLKMICDCDSDFHIQSQNMSQRFLNRSYKKNYHFCSTE